MGIEFRILGPVEVVVDGAPVHLGGRKQRALLGALLVHRNRPLSVERLVDEIWGDHPPASPVRSIQVYVSALRTALRVDGGVLENMSQGYRLRVDEKQLDADLFEAAAINAKALLTGGEVATAAQVAATALALWRGPALGELADFPFARAEAARLEEMRLQTIDDRFEAELALGHHDHVVAELAVLVEQYPLRENSRRQLMLALYRCGRPAEALAVYRAGRRYLVDELGLEPSRPLQDLHQAILGDDPTLRVEPAELRGRRHLPAPATALIGRRNEIDELTAMLRQPGVRLVTATGPGGIGKTRLALQGAHELADAFRDGVFFVGLAELKDPELVVPTLAAAVDVEEVPDQPLLATLADALANYQMLLLLDNFEHVDDAAPSIGRLLAAASGLKVLATSRSRLRIYGEHEYPVPRLALQEEAVPLFSTRATAADRNFRLTDLARKAVGDVCLRLDCLPLAIELAAARITEFTLEEMLTVLPRPLDLATSGPRDFAARQQTLWAAVDWSYQLLSPPEQAVFTGFAVFVGGGSEGAVAAVCGSTTAQLVSLAAKSLVVRRPAEAEGRMDMLQTIREYALKRLDQDPARADAVRDAHARYFVALAETAVDGMRGPDQRRWSGLLQTDRDNLRAALSYLLAEPGSKNADTAELALRLAAALGFFWYKTGSVGEGSAWLERALAAAPSAPDVLRARALHALGILVAERGDAERALRHLDVSCELFRQVGELPWVARSLNSQGGIARDIGDFDRAERIFAESADLRRRLGDDQASLAIVLGNLAMVALDRRNFVRARKFGEECLQLSENSDSWLHAATLQLLADVAVEEGDLAKARELLRSAYPALRELGSAYRLVELLDSCAGLAVGVGRADTAARLLGAADSALEEVGARMVPADAQLRERRITAVRDSLGDDTFERRRRDGRALTLEQALDMAFADVIPPRS